jgi:hypothetical protein
VPKLPNFHVLVFWNQKLYCLILCSVTTILRFKEKRNRNITDPGFRTTNNSKSKRNTTRKERVLVNIFQRRWRCNSMRYTETKSMRLTIVMIRIWKGQYVRKFHFQNEQSKISHQRKKKKMNKERTLSQNNNS